MANEKKLTDKQKRFCEEYLIDLNATQAAIRSGYSEKTAAAQAARLLINVKVQAYISELREKQSRRTEITADRVLEELAAIAFSDRTEIAYIENRNVVLVSTDKWSENTKKSVAGIKENQNGIEVKSYDKVRALELIGKHLGMFDAQNHSGQEEIEDNGFIEALNGTAAEDWSGDNE